MLDIDFFVERHVVWARHGFLSPAECSEIMMDMTQHMSIPSTSYDEVRGAHISKDRKTREHKVSAETHQKIINRLQGLMPEIREHFKQDIQNIETLQFLRYPVGYFFKAHRDKVLDSGFRPRLITVVIFLNNQQKDIVPEDSPDFSGGSLVFYGNLKQNIGKLGLPMRAEAGSIIAFNPQFTHEVTPVSSGNRFTIITWFN